MTFAHYQTLFRDGDDVVNVESDEHLTLPGVHPVLGIRTTTLPQFEEVVDRIHEHLPDVRILMVIRNQASLVVSRYSEYLIMGGNRAFEEFAQLLMDDGLGHNLHYQNYYSRIIDTLERRFPHEHLMVLLQESMREDQDRTFSAIAHFLTLGELQDMKKGLLSERPSLSLAGLQLLRAINRLLVAQSSIGGEPPTTRVPVTVYQFVVKIIRAVDYFALARISRSSSALLTEARRRSILAHFREDNLRLQARIGLNLSKLGYLEPADPLNG